MGKTVCVIFNEVACSTSSAVFSQSTSRCQCQRLRHEDAEQIIGKTSNQTRVLCTCGHGIDTKELNRPQVLVGVTSLVDGDTKLLGVSFPSLLLSQIKL